MSKNKTIGESLDGARHQSGAKKLAGHDIMALERFAPDTRHMIVFNVLTMEDLHYLDGIYLVYLEKETVVSKISEGQEKLLGRIQVNLEVC